MLQFVFALVLLALSGVALVLRKTYFYLPRKELQRHAAQHDPLASTLWRAAAYGSSLQLFLWLVIGLGAAAGFVLLARIAPPLLGFVVVTLTLWFGFAWMPSTRLTSFGAQIAVWCTPAVVWVLSLTQPVTSHIAGFLERFPIGPHTGIYEKADMLELLKRQKGQPDNRMSDEELSLVEQALKFDEYKVHDVLMPRSNVKAVSLDDAVGPILMDELHATNHVRFPVYADDKNTIVGTLFLHDIVGDNKGGRVADYADTHIATVHDQDSLSDALRAFRSAKQPILVVLSSADEYVGIVTVSDVLGKLIAMPGTSSPVEQAADAPVDPEQADDAADEADKSPELPQNSSEVVE